MTRAAAIRSISSSSRGRSTGKVPVPRPKSHSAGSRFHPPSPRRSARSSASCRTMHAACSRARRWPATPSSPSWLQRLQRHRRPRPWMRSTSCSCSTSSERPRCRAVFASGIRSSAVPCTRRRPAVGGWVRTSAVRTCWQRAARRLRRAPIMSSGPRARATSPLSRSCARQVRALLGSHRQARRAGSPRHFASFRRPRRQASGSSFCSLVLQRRRRADVSLTVTASCWRQSRSLPTTRRSRAGALPSRVCLDDTNRPARVLRARSNAFRTRALPKPSHS